MDKDKNGKEVQAGNDCAQPAEPAPPGSIDDESSKQGAYGVPAIDK